MRGAVAIVGMGPRGLFAFERLLAHLAATAPARRRVAIHLFDPHRHFGAGANYDPAQPAYLALNFPVGHVDAWRVPSPRPLPARTPSLLRWLQEQEPEAGWSESGYTSRAQVGRYLESCFRDLLAAVPDGVEVHRQRRRVVDLRRDGERFRLFVDRPGQSDGGDDDGGRPLDVAFDAVLLTPGHTPDRPTEDEEREIAHAAADPAIGHVRAVFPVDAWRDRVPAGARIGIRGMGLTFIDTVRTLTEGRGGRFVRGGDDGRAIVDYAASGEEPARIVPFSISGLLPSPKPRGRWPARDTFRPRFLTHDAVARCREETAGGRLDFAAQLRPMLRREMDLAFYRVLLDGAARQRLEAAARAPETFDDFLATLRAARPELPRFALATRLDPRVEDDFASPEAHHRAILERLERDIAEARRGMKGSAPMAALEVWNRAFSVVAAAVEDGGLTPASHRAFDREVKRPLGRAVYGPPLANAERIAVLARRGLLDFGCAADGKAEPIDGGYAILSGRIAGARREVDWLIDARMPSADIEADASPLLRRLHRRGTIRGYINRATDDDENAYRAGGIDLAAGTGTVRAADGEPVPGLAAMGWIMEGPQVGNDALFREVNDFSNGWAAVVIERLRRRS